MNPKNPTNPRFRQLFFLLVALTALASFSLPGCKIREEELTTTGGLEFSADTVKFDTVFTTLRTVTKRLWVYNRQARAVSIGLISLENPAGSPYTLLINGVPQQTARDLLVRGQDSALILVRAKLPDNGQNGTPKQYVIEERLNFSTNGQQQHVLLRSFGQNIYLHDGTSRNVVLPCNTTWTNDRPHVLYDTVEVPVGCTLRLKPGTRVFAHPGAVLLVRGTLLVNAPVDFTPGAGAIDTISAKNANVVRFAGDRSGELDYATAPGQWNGLVFYPSSRGNLIRYAVIQNAAQAVLVLNLGSNPAAPPSPAVDVTLQNTVIRYIAGGNASFAGAASNLLGLPGAAVLSISGRVTAENCLFYDCYEYALLGYGGGTYDFNFCTVANFAATGSVRKLASATFTNVPLDTTRRYPLTLRLRNSIIWGGIDDELYLPYFEQYKATTSIQNCLLKTQYYQAATDAQSRPGLAAPALRNLVNQDPQFRRPFGSTFGDYRLKSTSPAYKRATPAGSVPDRDLLNLPRAIGTPSLGAYESSQ